MINNEAELSEVLSVLVNPAETFDEDRAAMVARALVEQGVTFNPRPRGDRKLSVGTVLGTEEEVEELIEPFNASGSRMMYNTVVSDTSGQVFVLIDDDNIPWRGMTDGWCSKSSFKYPVTVLQLGGKIST